MISVYPKTSVGNIKLGDNIQLIRSYYKDKYFSEESNNKINDYYQEDQIHVQYRDGKAIYIGVNLPLQAEYNGVNLSLARYSQIKEIFNNSQEKYGDNNSLTFMDLGITFYFEDDDEDPQPLQVAIFVDGYYANVIIQKRADLSGKPHCK